MLRRMTFLRTDVSEELIAFMIRVLKIGELKTTLAVTSNLSTLHPDEGGDTLLQNVGSYKSHMAYHPRRRHSSCLH
jgi:hypothetical protein